MADRQRVRVGRDVTYFPTDAQVAAVTGTNGEAWSAKIAKVSTTSVRLNATRSDGSVLALTSIAQGQRKGTYSLAVVNP